MYCQVCGAPNRDDHEYCVRCHQKLLVLSGSLREDEESYEESRRGELLLRRAPARADLHPGRGGQADGRDRAPAPGRPPQAGEEHPHQPDRPLGPARAAGAEAATSAGRSGASCGSPRWTTSSWPWRSASASSPSRSASPPSTTATSARSSSSTWRTPSTPSSPSTSSAPWPPWSPPTSSTADNYELAYFLGETHFNEGDTEQALAYFARVLEVKPDHYEGLVYSGVIYYERGDHDRAEELPEARGRASIPTASCRTSASGRSTPGRGTWPRPCSSWSGRCEVDPVPQALYLLGSCYYEMGKLSLAVHYLQEAVRHDPAFEEAHHLLGPRLPRPPLDAQGARLVPPGAAAQPEEAPVPGPGALPLGRRRLAAAGGATARPRPGSRRARSCSPASNLKQAHCLLPPRAGARSGQPDAPDVLRPALPAPQPQPGDRGGDPQGAGPEARARCSRRPPTPP